MNVKQNINGVRDLGEMELQKVRGGATETLALNFTKITFNDLSMSRSSSSLFEYTAFKF